MVGFGVKKINSQKWFHFSIGAKKSLEGDLFHLDDQNKVTRITTLDETSIYESSVVWMMSDQNNDAVIRASKLTRTIGQAHSVAMMSNDGRNYGH